MPIYEYQCTACEYTHEALQKMNDVPLVDCPKCTKPTLKKKLSAAAFKLKGKGWYTTDFKDKEKKSVEKPSTHKESCSNHCACK